MVSDKLIALVKSSEGCSLTAYPDPATGAEPFTVGYGCTGPDITEGTTWTQEQCEEELVARLEALQVKIQELLSVPVSSNQISALVDFAYNLGIGALESSFLLKCINVSNFDAAAEQFGKWVHASGKVMPGLVKRREAERVLFTTPDSA